MLRDRNRDGTWLKMNDEAGTQRASGDFLALYGEGASVVGRYVERSFTFEQLNGALLAGEGHIDGGVGIQRHPGSIVQQHDSLLSCPGMIIGQGRQ